VPAAIIIPTRGRPDYLEVTLASVMPQARALRAQAIVVEDGRHASTESLARSHGARYLSLGTPRGLNAARNAGAGASVHDLLVFIDDDVEVAEGWLAAYEAAARELPDVGVFTGPIRARLEGRGGQRRTCGGEGPPITHADHGAGDRDVRRGWGANLAVRRSTLERVGPFDESVPTGAGDEEEWEERYLATGGRIRYVAAAALDHRRNAADSRVRALALAAARRGASARRYDERRGAAPPLAAELRTLAGCVWHTIARRCANGPVMAAHSAGRVAAALAARSAPPAAGDDFLSGESGTIGGKRDALREAGDLVLDALALPERVRLARVARREPPRRRLLVLSVVREQNAAGYRKALRELRRTRHDLVVASGVTQARGRFENLNLLLGAHRVEEFDWLLLLDDDVRLPRGFLDGFINQAERHSLRLAQPAHRLRSHAAWRVTRRRAFSVVRETAFVEIGPVTALHRETFGELLPFPDLRMGWGLDAHWAALARDRGWRAGVVDVLPIAHRAAPAAAAYSRAEAIGEARAFLAERPYLPASELRRTLAVHRRCA
jgi:GT2 family glycosyltransferase